jgi:hypothetical protein
MKPQSLIVKRHLEKRCEADFGVCYKQGKCHNLANLFYPNDVLSKINLDCKPSNELNLMLVSFLSFFFNSEHPHYHEGIALLQRLGVTGIF